MLLGDRPSGAWRIYRRVTSWPSTTWPLSHRDQAYSTGPASRTPCQKRGSESISFPLCLWSLNKEERRWYNPNLVGLQPFPVDILQAEIDVGTRRDDLRGPVMPVALTTTTGAGETAASGLPLTVAFDQCRVPKSTTGWPRLMTSVDVEGEGRGDRRAGPGDADRRVGVAPVAWDRRTTGTTADVTCQRCSPTRPLLGQPVRGPLRAHQGAGPPAGGRPRRGGRG
jgi:hypothetical protein